jgi:hypothetical protein
MKKNILSSVDDQTPLSVDAIRAMSQGKIQTSNVMRDDFGMSVAIEAVPLPSRGVIYSPESPVFGRETLDIKAMTAREEDILTSRAHIKNGTVITELIKSCLIDKSIDVDELIAGDRVALMVALRITGYGADYEVECECPKCNAKTKQSFNLADLKIKRLEIDPVSEGSNLFEVVLPVSKKTLKVKFLNGYDEKELSTLMARKQKLGLQTDSLITDKLNFSITSVDNITDKNKISQFVNNMPARDSLVLRRFLDNNEPGIDMNVTMKCTSCFEESDLKLPLGVSFFWPDQ